MLMEKTTGQDSSVLARSLSVELSASYYGRTLNDVEATDAMALRKCWRKAPG